MDWGGGVQGGGKIGICDAFLMHFGIFRNKFISDNISDGTSDAFRIFVDRVKKKIKHLLTGGVLGIFEKFGDIGSDIGLWCTY